MTLRRLVYELPNMNRLLLDAMDYNPVAPVIFVGLDCCQLCRTIFYRLPMS